MADLSITLIFSSFVAGVFTFFAPCTLPLVPAFLGIIAGVDKESLQNREGVRRVRWKVFTNALFYVLGFTSIFILFGLAFSFLGKVLFIRIWLQRIGGILIILFGLFLLGWLKIPWLESEKQIRVPKFFRSSGRANSFGIGALFALSWSPCVGPLLGSILFLASNSGTVFEGVFLLVMFSLGLGIPFLLTALLIGKTFDLFSKMEGVLKVINIIAGLFLVLLGFLLVSNQFSSTFGMLTGYFYRFQFYEKIINRFF